MWSLTSTSEGNGRKRDQEDQWLPRDKVGYIYMCAKVILEKKLNNMCEMKEEIRKVVVGSDFFFQETTKVTLITLKLALESLFFALEFLQNDSLDISSFFCDVYFGIIITNTENTWLWH